MRCEQSQDAISSRIDGETAGIDGHAVDSHLDRCRPCQAFAADAEAMRRLIRLGPADAVPDLTASVLAAIGAQRRQQRGWRVPGPRRSAVSGRLGQLRVRVALGALAVFKLAIAIPALILGSESGAAVHVAREVGSFEVALAFGLLVVAWQPVRASGLFPLMAVLTVCLAASAAVDVATGDEGVAVELTHVTEVVGLTLVWMLARVGVARPGRGGLGLRAVDRSTSSYA